MRRLLPFFEADPDRAAFLFLSGGNPVGFAFLNRTMTPVRRISEFFVVRGLRGRGIASTAAGALFARYPGEWEIPFQESNVVVARFWRRVAADVAVEGVREERRPVPGKAEVPPDVWIMITVA